MEWTICDCGGVADVEKVVIDVHDPNVETNGLGKVMKFMGVNIIVARAAFNLIECQTCGRKVLEIVCDTKTDSAGSGSTEKPT